MDAVQETAKEHCKPIFVLVGNKVDLEKSGMRQVQRSEANEKKEELDCAIF